MQHLFLLITGFPYLQQLVGIENWLFFVKQVDYLWAIGVFSDNFEYRESLEDCNGQKFEVSWWVKDAFGIPVKGDFDPTFPFIKLDCISLY